ncbi:MAG TPA: acyltransferase [Longimicrobiales bacterium]
MADQITWRRILQRFRWELLVPYDRAELRYWFIRQFPGLTGNMLRTRHIARRVKKSGSNLSVYAGCRFRSLQNLEVGDNVTIGYDNFFQARAGLTIGNNVITGPGVKIWTANHDYGDPDAAVADQGHTERAVVIGDNVFVGGNSFILPGVHLPEGCIVSAGSVVGMKAYRPFSILAGNPARVIGYRGNRVPEPGADQAPAPSTNGEVQSAAAETESGSPASGR